MRKPNIHSSTEDVQAFNTEGVNSGMKNANDTLKSIEKTLKQPIATITGLQALNDKQRETNENLKGVKASIDIQTVDSLRKLEEIKSASLIANQELKKIASKETPVQEFPEFPKEIEVSLKGAELVTIKGAKGDKGDKGNPGKDADETMIVEKVVSKIPKPKDGKDGKNIDENRVIRSVLSKIPIPKDGVDGKNGKDGANGSLDAPDEVVEKINQSTKRIKPKQIEGLSEALKFVSEFGSNPQGAYASGGANQLRLLTGGTVVSEFVTEINFSDNITATYNGNGRVTLTSTSGVETPTESPNGSRTTFTVTHTPVMVISDAGTYFSGAGYTYSGGVITMTSPPVSFIRIIY